MSSLSKVRRQGRAGDVSLRRSLLYSLQDRLAKRVDPIELSSSSQPRAILNAACVRGTALNERSAVAPKNEHGQDRHTSHGADKKHRPINHNGCSLDRLFFGHAARIAAGGQKNGRERARRGVAVR